MNGFAMTETNPATARLRLGTRGSELALLQTRMVADSLAIAVPELAEEGAIHIEVIETRGDASQAANTDLSKIGGKGLWTEEFDEAIADGRIDLAVHSMKDVPTVLPDGQQIAAMLPRADVRDAFFSNIAGAIMDLPEGAVIGTSSLRRGAQMRRLRPDFKVVTFRGNVGTRLEKLNRGDVDATLLAMAGVTRMGLVKNVTAPIDPSEMLPAIAQGAIGVQCRNDDDFARAACAAINHAETDHCVSVERALLAALDGSCKTPIAGLATQQNDIVTLHAEVLRPDGSEHYADSQSSAAADAMTMGKEMGERLKADLPDDFFTG
ncbi:MAG: hydroxymethylbilane synthase [Alphaproteobacteria bacterium]